MVSSTSEEGMEPVLTAEELQAARAVGEALGL